MPDSSVDHDALEQAVSSTLEDLKHCFLHPSAIYFDETQDMFSGGYGDVHKAVFFVPVYSSQIAVKKLRPAGTRTQRLRVAAALARELRVWEQLDHPNVLSLVGFYLDKESLDCAWLITWWQSEGDILGFIDRTKADDNKRLQLAQDTAEGLAYLHGHIPRVCHGDIKPANTLVSSEARAMLCDFGLARIMDEVPSGLTTSKRIVGTPRYASPELFMDDDHAHTFASDTWAWGCLFLEVMTGTKPYKGHDEGLQLYLAVAENALPAEIDTIETQDFVKELLRKVWVLEADKRLSMSDCALFLQNCIQS